VTWQKLVQLGLHTLPDSAGTWISDHAAGSQIQASWGGKTFSRKYGGKGQSAGTTQMRATLECLEWLWQLESDSLGTEHQCLQATRSKLSESI
jgi:hypothetical protein